MTLLRIALTLLTLALACAGGHARTVHSTDAVAPDTATTYADLVALVVPGGVAIPVADIGFEDIDDTLAPASAANPTLSAVPVRSGGRERVALLLDFGSGQYTVGFAILALFDVSDEPRLIAAANVALGEYTAFADPAILPVHAGNDLLAIRSTHHNSSQNYAHTALILLHDDRLDLVDIIFTFSDRACAFDRNQQLDLQKGAGQPFADILVTVTETTVPSGEQCGDAALPEAGTRTIAATYGWDAAARRYRPQSDAMENLARENDERL